MVELSQITENPAVTGGDGGKGVANLNYILYIVGFFTGITAFVGVILAYVNREDAAEPFKSHLTWQIKIFWRGVIFAALYTVLYLAASAIAVASMGLGLVLMILPIGAVIWWAVWTVMAIVKGMKALGRGVPVRAK